MRRAWPALALVLLLAACGGGAAATEPAPTPAEPADTTQSAEPPEGEPKNSDREQAPELEGTTLDGKEVSLADFRGKPVFIKFFASW